MELMMSVSKLELITYNDPADEVAAAKWRPMSPRWQTAEKWAVITYLVLATIVLLGTIAGSSYGFVELNSYAGGKFILIGVKAQLLLAIPFAPILIHRFMGSCLARKIKSSDSLAKKHFKWLTHDKLSHVHAKARIGQIECATINTNIMLTAWVQGKLLTPAEGTKLKSLFNRMSNAKDKAEKKEIRQEWTEMRKTLAIVQPNRALLKHPIVDDADELES